MDPATATKKITALINSGQARYYTARDRVERSTINTLLDVLGDRNPIYTDDEAAQAHGHPGAVAPPAALQVWTMSLLGEQGEGDSPVDRAYQILRDCGFPNVVAVNSEQHYDRYIRPGDLISSQERVHSLSELKQTGLGPGMFITTKLSFTDEHQESVGTMLFRTLWYSTEKGA